MVSVKPNWECVLEAKAQVGEEPMWSPKERCLYWIDIYGPSLHRTDPETGETRRWTFPDTVGSYALLDDASGAIVALRSGIYRLDFSTEDLEELHAAPYDTSVYRFNDGRCDRQGRFWVGTTRLPDAEAPERTSAFWRLDEAGLSRELEDLTVANGIAFSPDGRTLYLANRPGWEVLAFDYDRDTGVASNRRTFARVPEGQFPDGAAVDSEGGYWIALYRAGRVVRFSPEGELTHEMIAPTTLPTMVAFGGDDLSTLYLTTARRSLTDADLAGQPLAGAIFRCQVDATGIAEPSFGAFPG